jgi:hypothetical protein
MIDDLAVYPGDTVESYPSSAYLDFEQIPDFSLDFTPWTVRDVNGGNTYGIENCFFPNNGSPMAWINFNPSAANPPPLNMSAHSGNKLGACFSSIPPNNPNNKWLISPKLNLEENAKISFWVQTYNLQYGYEKFRVGVSTTGNDPSDFEIITGDKPDSAGVVWKNKVYTLEQYSGKDIYIGIQCVTDNGFCLMLDDIEISSSVGFAETYFTGTLSVYPVPADDRLFIKTGGVAGGEIRIRITNLYGGTVYECLKPFDSRPEELDISAMSEGLFIISIEDGRTVRTGKFIIDR